MKARGRIDAHLSPSRPSAEAGQGAEARRRVLVVDDQPDVRLWLRVSLTAAGFEVVEAASVEEALAALRRFKLDVVLTDLMMPGRDGRELIRLLAREETTRDIPVIVLTAAARATVSGAAAVLHKPCDARRIASTIGDLLRIRRS